MRRKWIVGSILAVLAVVVLGVALSDRQSLGQAPPALDGSRPMSSVRSSQGKLSVTYNRQEGPSTRSESTIKGVTAIEFYPSYVVYRTKDGGTLLPMEKTYYFSWSGTED
jgi:hypothetical protein